ncbi:MAG: ROK family transcriptional regulator [Anaeromyxobacter sp.]
MTTTRHPPPSPRRTVGSNQVGMRQYNERVVLQAIRLRGALPKADLARITRLSTQTASTIVDTLLEDGLVVKQERVRGRIGQPSVPIALNPEGAFTVGIKVGRRSLDVLALDFLGQVRARESLAYELPEPKVIFPAIRKRLAGVNEVLGRHARRVVGVGVAAPLGIGGWGDVLGAPPGVMEAWEHVDIAARVQEMTKLPVEFAKDTTAACAAELVVGQGRELRNFLYVFIGTFIGGGLVLDGRLHTGPHGNAGAVGSMPVPGPERVLRQLLDRASGLLLEERLRTLGSEPTAAHDERALSSAHWPTTHAWVDETSAALAPPLASAAALLDLDAVVIDGSMHRQVMNELASRVERALDRQDWEGMRRPRVVVGSVGADARALGGAILPLYRHFAPLHDLFLKSEPDEPRAAPGRARAEAT